MITTVVDSRHIRLVYHNNIALTMTMVFNFVISIITLIHIFEEHKKFRNDRFGRYCHRGLLSSIAIFLSGMEKYIEM